MKKITMLAPCHFGLEAVLKRELTDLGYEILKTEDGKVYFTGEMSDICRANIFLRTAERILLLVGEFEAKDFETLFNKTYELPWEDYIPADGRVWVTKANTVKSILAASVPVQSIMKKAMAKRLGEVYGTEILPETGADYPVRVSILKDMVTVTIDTTGDGLHKRGYRKNTTKAPIEETLAAALIMLTPWKYDRCLIDPFCGSGTFAIEAALMALDIAPGMNRSFTAESWTNIIEKKHWYTSLNEAIERAKKAENRRPIIYASDIDPEVLDFAMKNAELAGVKEHIRFSCKPVKEMKLEGEYGFIITNPPYGLRLEDAESAIRIYKEFVQNFTRAKTWSAYVITPVEDTEKLTGRKADKKRKIYNGMLKTDFYAFCGPKPPKDWVNTLYDESRPLKKEEAPLKVNKAPEKKQSKIKEDIKKSEPATKHLTALKGRKFTTSGKATK